MEGVLGEEGLLDLEATSGWQPMRPDAGAVAWEAWGFWLPPNQTIQVMVTLSLKAEDLREPHSTDQEIKVQRMEVMNVVTQLVSGQTRDTDLVLSDSKLCACPHHCIYPKQSRCHLRRDSKGRGAKMHFAILLLFKRPSPVISKYFQLSGLPTPSSPEQADIRPQTSPQQGID